LFRYLSDHPSVCPSRIKEIHFFLKHKDAINSSVIKEYQSFFSLCSSSQLIRVEASPLYLMESSSVVESMYKILPNLKLIFILREPVSILLSYIKFKSVISAETYPVELFTAMAGKNGLTAFHSKKKINVKNALNHLKAGCFVSSLKDYLAYYPRDQIGIFFFDELSKDTPSLIHKVCDFLDIDSGFYNDYQFKTENKTRSYKYPQLHRLVVTMNMKFEFLFNQYPLIRNCVRSAYHSLCEAPEKKLETAESDINQLERFYEPYNRELYSLLEQTYPDVSLPLWLNKYAKY